MSNTRLKTQFQIFKDNKEQIVLELCATDGHKQISFKKNVSLFAKHNEVNWKNCSLYCFEMEYKHELYILSYNFALPKMLSVEICQNWSSDEVEESGGEFVIPHDLDEAGFFQQSVLHNMNALTYDVYREIIDYTFELDKSVASMKDDYNSVRYFMFENKLYCYSNLEVTFFCNWTQSWLDCDVHIDTLRSKGKQL